MSAKLPMQPRPVGTADVPARRLWLGVWLSWALLIGIAVLANGEERLAQAQTAAEQRGTASAGVLALLPPDSVTDHKSEIGGGELAYTATAGTLDLYSRSGERSAAVFYTAYALKNAPAEARPITFVFNGGPGAASAFLHLGLVGPKILDFGPSGRDGANAQLIANPHSWLGFTDLVLIDPVGTGWSRTAKPDEAKQYWGVDQDARALAKAIGLYLAKNPRAASPKYLLGESYGGFRAVKVARALQRDQGNIVSGILMLSPLLEGALTFNADRFPFGAALKLPSLAAAELERRRAFTPEALAQAERFAMTEYVTTLAGRPPEGEAARAFYGRIAELTGLPLDVVERTRGFIRDSYIKHLRETDGDVVSPYDGTFAAPDPFPELDTARGDDPILDGFVRAYAGAFTTYAREELGFKTDITYTLLAGEVSGNWDWGDRGSMAQASATDDLRELLALNTSMRLFVAHGVSDLVTPYGVSRYVLDHLPPLGGADRVALKLYRGGHMVYLVPESRLAFTIDARAFYGALSQ